MAERVEVEEGDREPPSRGESPAAFALAHALDRGRSHTESVAFSSELLPLDAELLGYSSPDQARLMSMKRLDLAARDQRARNEADLLHLGEIQTGLVWATLFAVLAVTAHLLSFAGGA